ncbi:unnamed protein product [Symbiodinium sp. KB8]|nr:unnamed protein product [Symbiodinium sp. KB8]
MEGLDKEVLKGLLLFLFPIQWQTGPGEVMTEICTRMRDCNRHNHVSLPMARTVRNLYGASKTMASNMREAASLVLNFQAWLHFEFLQVCRDSFSEVRMPLHLRRCILAAWQAEEPAQGRRRALRDSRLISASKRARSEQEIRNEANLNDRSHVPLDAVWGEIEVEGQVHQTLM